MIRFSRRSKIILAASLICLFVGCYLLATLYIMGGGHRWLLAPLLFGRDGLNVRFESPDLLVFSMSRGCYVDCLLGSECYIHGLGESFYEQLYMHRPNSFTPTGWDPLRITVFERISDTEYMFTLGDLRHGKWVDHKWLKYDLQNCQPIAVANDLDEALRLGLGTGTIIYSMK